MLRTVFFLLFIFSVGLSFAQKSKKLKAPPGTVQINDTLFADRTEIANVHFREYLHWLLKYDSLNYEKMLPDTTVWNDTLILNENQATQFYFRHPGFNNSPVVGISYEQAIEFCKWRTLAVNHLFYCKENNLTCKSDFSNESFPIKILYRLPTKQEWEMLAANNRSVDKYPYGADSIYVKWRKKYWKAFNCYYSREPNLDSISKENVFYTVEVRSMFPNGFKLYNLIGNLAEMVSEKGIAKGGSFNQKLEDCKITNSQYYTKPERWLGFRCVAVIVK